MRKRNHLASVPFATMIKLLVVWDVVFGIGFVVLAYFNGWGTWAILFGLSWVALVAVGGLAYMRYLARQDEVVGEADSPDQPKSLFR